MTELNGIGSQLLELQQEFWNNLLCRTARRSGGEAKITPDRPSVSKTLPNGSLHHPHSHVDQ